MKFEDFEMDETEDFAAMLEESFKKSESRSDLVAGTIVKIDEKDNLVVVDIGGGRDANLDLSEIKDEDDNIIFAVNDTIDVFDFFEMLLDGAKFRVKIRKLVGIKEFFRRKDIEKDWIFKTIDVLKEIRRTIEEKRVLVKDSVITYPKFLKE